MDLRNSNGFELRNSYLTTVQKIFGKFSSEVEKCIMCSSIQVFPNQVSKNRSVRLKILTYESPMRRYIKNRAKLWELIQF